MVEISHYRKFNRCKDGNLAAGDVAPSVTIYALPTVTTPTTPTRANEGAATELLSLVQGMRPLVLFAGSYS